MRSEWFTCVFLTLASSLTSIGAVIFASTLSEIGRNNAEQKIQRGSPSNIVSDKSVVEMSFPQLNFNDSNKLHGEEERITKNEEMKSGIAKRSVRAHLPFSRYPSYNTKSYSRFDRFDNRRNSLESAADGSSSSSWGGKWFNQLKRRTSSMMNPMTSYDRQQMYQSQGTAEEPEMAATFLSGGGGGWGQSSHYGKGVNKSAVGLLGFLSLLSLIQNVLNQTSTMQGRRKRDVSWDDVDWDEPSTEITQLAPYLLPLMDVVAHAQRGQLAVDCTLQPICITNQVLVEKLGTERGGLVGQVMSEALSKTIRQAGCRWKTSNLDITSRAIRAGISGRYRKNCNEIYRNCTNEIARLPKHYSKGLLLTALSQL